MTTNKSFRLLVVDRFIADKVEYDLDGNFTICRLRVGQDEAVACAKRNPIDRNDLSLGYDIAYYRAVRKFYNRYPQNKETLRLMRLMAEEIVPFVQ